MHIFITRVGQVRQPQISPPNVEQPKHLQRKKPCPCPALASRRGQGGALPTENDQSSKIAFPNLHSLPGPNKGVNREAIGYVIGSRGLGGRTGGVGRIGLCKSWALPKRADCPLLPTLTEETRARWSRAPVCSASSSSLHRGLTGIHGPPVFQVHTGLEVAPEVRIPCPFEETPHEAA